MNWDKERKIYIEEEASKLVALRGKTIKFVESSTTWDGSEIDQIRILFTDGTIIELNAGSDGGCEECDPDGSKISYIHTYIGKK